MGDRRFNRPTEGTVKVTVMTITLQSHVTKFADRKCLLLKEKQRSLMCTHFSSIRTNSYILWCIRSVPVFIIWDVAMLDNENAQRLVLPACVMYLPSVPVSK